MLRTIRPTTTQRVRELLSECGAAPRPWASLDDTYAALYRLLRTRTADDAFWKPLSGLLRDLVADAAEGPRRLPARGAELLRSWDIDDLTRDLRRALPSPWEDTPPVRRFTSSLAAPALGGFLLLGLAATGCDTSGEDDAWAEGCSIDDGTEIYAAIDENDTLTSEEKTDLCGCMAAMQADWQADLSAVFEGCDAESIATALEDIVARCDAEDGDLSENPGDEASAVCWGAPAYKGVSFPS